ncbi:MAG: HAMP domain-containing protein [Pseudobdellovibrionaceae bacterium]
MSNVTQEKNRNHRVLTNLVINSRAQFKFFVPFFILLGLHIAFVFYSQRTLSSIAFEVGGDDPAHLTRVHYAENKILFSSAIGILVFGFATFIFWFIASHRIFGPVVAIRRQLENLNSGRYEARIKLRKTDEFHEIAEDLNRLAETLQSRHTKP